MLRKRKHIIILITILTSFFLIRVDFYILKNYFDKKANPQNTRVNSSEEKLYSKSLKDNKDNSNQKKKAISKPEANLEKRLAQSTGSSKKASINQDLLELPNANNENQAKQRLDSFTFAVIGDSESYNSKTGYNKEFKDVLEIAKSYNPDFVIFTGDIITASGKASEISKRIKNVKTLIEEYFPVYYITLGNHDVECGIGCVDLWEKIFWNKEYEDEEERRVTYFDFDYLNTHFVILSTEYPVKHSIDKRQLSWLEENLLNVEKTHTIIIEHTPPVSFFKESSQNCHDMSCSEPQRSDLVSIFDDYEVDLVIAGHEHTFDYQKVNYVHYIISGNCGNHDRYGSAIEGDVFTLVEVTGNNIIIKAIKTNSEVVKKIKIK